MQVSCVMPSRRHLVFLMLLLLFRRHRACHSLNVLNIINWKRNFKENILIKKYLGERITKEVVIIRIKSYFSAFH